ncbi:hypothetical protein ACFRIB_01460 [Streptomyces mirabilis]|uniref:hypothetical protein n=1 Tax=Streptomyces mirabilis TaxID=68239 RepID=UPI003693CC38
MAATPADRVVPPVSLDGSVPVPALDGGDFSRLPVGSRHAPKAARARQAVEETIRLLDDRAAFYGESTKVPPLEKELRDWQRRIEKQSGRILDELDGDTALFRSFRRSYQSALTALVDTAARLSGRPSAVLFERYRALIPEWAFPAQEVPGITAPVPFGVEQQGDGQVEFDLNSVHVTVLPDTEASQPASHFSIKVRADFESWPNDGLVITQLGWYIVHATFQTIYDDQVERTAPSAYGSGTTREDIAAGDTSVRFHESRHGLDFLRYVREHQPPRFPGRVGMTVDEFHTARESYDETLARYLDDMVKDTQRRTHCRGRTIDTYNKEHGIDIEAECR